MTARSICILTASLFLFVACGDDSSGQNNNACPEGFEQRGRACVPIFDDCSGPAEIPVLGGGCQPVGVTECATGFVSDGEGGCDPILPSDPCPAGTMEMIGHTECQPVGVTECAAGFVSDGEGGCDPILPPGPDPCPFGTIEVLGYTECQPIGDCGTGTWGNITTDATTVFVDASADATGADGSDASPFVTIGEALAVVEPGGQIAVAQGTYVERLVINQPVELAGRCAELVTIRGRFHLGQDRPPVTISAGGSGAAVRGVTLTGDAEGLMISAAQGVTVEEVQVAGTGSLGIWLNAEAAASLRRVVVAGCTDMGIGLLGSNLELSESVVRDTNTLANGTWGRGINAECEWGVCGSLSVERSLVAGNREMGIFVAGVDTSVTSTVVRDTLSNGEGMGGRGINAQCSSGGTCSSLAVERSLVAGNRDLGITISGMDATVTSTVVRDTLPQESDGTGGLGIYAECDEMVGVCGSVSVVGSLVAGNRYVGIFVGAVEATVTSTVVRDTLPNGEGDGGRGINAECQPHLGVCGSVSVVGSLVVGNRNVGTLVLGMDAVVTSTVVRDTLPDGDGTGGRGISALCDPEVDACGSLSVERSLVASNRDEGLHISGVDATVGSTVVRDTLPRASDGQFGRGINAQCDPDAGSCGSLNVTGSLVAGNRYVGIFTGVDTTVTSTVVRDTLSQQSDGKLGRGISTQCDERVGLCGSVSVVGSLVAGNRGVGIATIGVDTAVTSTVVRDTLPREGDGQFGRGISAQCHPGFSACGSLVVERSLVAGNRNVGICIFGMPATLRGVAVKDTRPNDGGPTQDEHGLGICALCSESTGHCSTLEMTSCVVESSYTVGVAVQGVPGSIESSVIASVLPQPSDEEYGYGIQIEGLEDFQLLGFDVRSCVIQDASLAGVLYQHARGTVSDTSTSGGPFAVVANVGSSPEIADDNDLTGTVQDGLYWGNMEPSPAPPPTLPIE